MRLLSFLVLALLCGYAAAQSPILRSWHFGTTLRGENVNGGAAGALTTALGRLVESIDPTTGETTSGELFLKIDVPSAVKTSVTSIVLKKQSESVSSPSITVWDSTSSQSLRKGVNYFMIDSLSKNRVGSLKRSKFYIVIVTNSNANGWAEGRFWHKQRFWFKSEMDQQQEIPAPLPYDGTSGTGYLKVENDLSAFRLAWYMEHTIVPGQATRAHVHGPAYYQNTASPFSTVAAGPEDALSPVVGEIVFFDQATGQRLLAFMLEALTYLNFHTLDFPTGIVRGIVLRVKQFEFSTQTLKSSRVVPAIPSDNFISKGFVKQLLFDDEFNSFAIKVKTQIDETITNPGGLYGNAKEGKEGSGYKLDVITVSSGDQATQSDTVITALTTLFTDYPKGPDHFLRLILQEKLSIQFGNSNEPTGVTRGQVYNWTGEKENGERVPFVAPQLIKL